MPRIGLDIEEITNPSSSTHTNKEAFVVDKDDFVEEVDDGFVADIENEDDGFVADVEEENDGFVADVDEDLLAQNEDDDFVEEIPEEEIAMNDSSFSTDGFVADVEEGEENLIDESSPIGQYISKRTSDMPRDLFSSLRQSWTVSKYLEQGTKPEDLELGGKARNLATDTPLLGLLAGPIGKTAKATTAIGPWMMGLGGGIAAAAPLAAAHAGLEGEDLGGMAKAATWDAAQKLLFQKGLPAVLKKFPVIGEAVGAAKITDDLYYWLKGRGMKGVPRPDIEIGGKYASIDTLKKQAVRNEMQATTKAVNENLTPKPGGESQIEIAGEYADVSKVKPVSQIPDEIITSALGAARSGKDKFTSFFDVEAPFRKMGAPDTGLAIKTMMSRKAAGEEKALFSVSTLNKFKLSPDDYVDVALLASKPTIPENLPPAKKAAVKYVRKMFDDYLIHLKEKGVLQKPFPESMIGQIDDTINALKSERDAALKSGMDLQSAKARSQVNKYNYTITRLKNLVESANNKIKSEVTRIEAKAYKHLPGGKGFKGVVKQGESKGVLSKAEANIRVAGIYERQRDNLLKTIAKLEAKKEALFADKSLSTSLLRELDDLDSTIINQQSLRDAFGQVKYVHMPLRIWMESANKSNPSGFGRSFAGFRNIKGRKSIDIQSLIDKGVIDRSQADIRDITANYIRYVEEQLAEKNIIDSAVKEGLARSAGKAPLNWVEMPARLVPGLKGKKVHPLFADYLESHFKHSGTTGRGFHTKALSLIKMGKFYNPLFLPMYDIYQGIMLGGFGPATHLRKAWKMSNAKPKDYWEAYKNGTFSVPFKNPWAKFTENLASLKAKNDNTLMIRALGKLQEFKKHPVKGTFGLPVNILKSFYNVTWNTAWKLDHVVRLSSYSYLKDKGFTSKESAQIAALFHGDYASVPAETRKMLNQLFFTPTFKIAMTKLYDKMAKSGLSVIAKGGMKELGGKELGTTASERIYGRGLIYTLGLNLAWDEMFKSQGFEVDQFGRRYTKTVDTDEGPKEMVYTISGPQNMIQRYIGRVGPIFAKDEPERMAKVANAIKWDMHPFYLWGVNLITNTSDDGYSPISNPFTAPQQQWMDISKYTLREMVGVFQLFLKEESERDKQANTAFKRNTNWMFRNVLKPISFRYIRKIDNERLQSKTEHYDRLFAEMFQRDPPENIIELTERTMKLNKMQQDIQKEMLKGMKQ